MVPTFCTHTLMDQARRIAWRMQPAPLDRASSTCCLLIRTERGAVRTVTMESTMRHLGMTVALATIQMGMRQLLRIMTGLSTALQATLARPNTIHLVHMYRDVFLAPLESTRKQLRRHARIVLLGNTITIVTQRQLAKTVRPGKRP